jgi:hypothetical protein
VFWRGCVLARFVTTALGLKPLVGPNNLLLKNHDSRLQTSLGVCRQRTQAVVQ